MKRINNVCGVDVAYKGNRSIAAAVVLRCRDQKATELARCAGTPSFPYVPGYLFMREAPLMVSAVKALVRDHDLILVDGHGIAHPRRAGLAVFVGLALDRPTIGVAKSLLVGKVGAFDGNTAPILLNGAEVGMVLRHPKTGKAYYASPGHRVTVEDTIRTLRSKYDCIIKALLLAHRWSKAEGPLKREGKLSPGR